MKRVKVKVKNILDGSMFVNRKTLGKIFDFFSRGKKDLSVYYPVRLPDGSLHWFDENGLKHRKKEPAVINANGIREYYKHGKRHRLDGAAVEDSKGKPQAWYIEDQPMSRGEFLRQKTSMCLKSRIKNLGLKGKL